MNARLQRRMAMSRRLLRRPLKITPPPDPAPLTRPLTDDEHEDTLAHDVTRAAAPTILDLILRDVDTRIAQASPAQAAALRREKDQILAEQAAALRSR